MNGCKELHTALMNASDIKGFLHDLTDLAARKVGKGAACAVTMRTRGQTGQALQTGQARQTGEALPTGHARLTGHTGKLSQTAAVTFACSDPLVEKVDELQYQLGDGPCLHALRDVEVVSIPDTATEDRWPEFKVRAMEAGIRSCLCVPFGAPAEAAVNFYSRIPGAFGETEIRRATEFAEQASGALAVAERIAALADVNGHLRASMATRTIIDTAIGIIIAREHCTREQAFDELKRESQNSNIKLRELAARIVSDFTGGPVNYSVRFDDPSAADTVG